MGTPKTITCSGVEFASVKELASAFGVHPSIVARRIRDGWTPEQSVGVSSKPKRKGHGREVIFEGKTYPHLKALADEIGVDPRTFRARLDRGASLEDAVRGLHKLRAPSPSAKPVEFEGVFYKSQDALARQFGQKASNVARRVRRGWTIRQALKLDPEPPRFRNFEGHARDLKWKNTRPTASGVEPVPDADGYKLYLVTNSVNGKQYVGLTIGSLKDRLKQHESAANRGRKAPLPNAIRKYGIHSFTIQLIRSDARTFEELQEQEIIEIASRGTISNGYNVAIGGAVGSTKPITIDGRSFPSRAQAAEYYGVDVAVFNLRLNRLQWTPEEAAQVVEKSWVGKEIATVIEGVHYSSIRQAAIARGLKYKKIHERMHKKGWTLEQAFELTDAPSTKKYLGQEIVVFGVTYKSIAQAAKAHDMHPETLRKKVASGMTPDDAVKSFKRKKIDNKAG